MSNQPDPYQLSILIDLRKEAGLNQSQMAERFGLRGHKSVGAWELGRATPPESRHRIKFMGYLWDDLGLRNKPEKFKEVWEVVVLNWEWEPISEREWHEHLSKGKPLEYTDNKKEQALLQNDAPFSVTPALPLPLPDELSSEAVKQKEAQKETILSEGDILKEIYHLFSKYYQQVIIMLLLISTLSGLMWIFSKVNQNTEPVEVASLPTTITNFFLENAGFEEERLGAWYSDEGCETQVKEGIEAYNGRQYLAVPRTSLECESVRQDIYPDLEVGQSYRFGVWARSSTPDIREARVILRLKSGIAETGYNKMPFFVSNEWRCAETVLEVQRGDQDRIVAELYLESDPDEIEYYFDNAVLTTNNDPICPTSVGLLNENFEEPSGASSWQSFQPECEISVLKDEAVAYDGEHLLVVNRENPACGSIYQDAPVVADQGETYRLSAWIRSPDGLSRTGKLVIWTNTGIPEKDERRFQMEGEEWHCEEVFLKLEHGRHMGLRADIIFDTEDTTFQFDNISLRKTSRSACPKTDGTLINSSFEENFEGWGWHESACASEIGLDVEAAYEGSRYLIARKDHEKCFLFFQRVSIRAEPNDTYNFSLWIRSPDGLPRLGTIAMYQDVDEYREEMKVPFRVSGPDWQCEEVSLKLEHASELLTAEVHLQMEGVDYHFDNTQLRLGEDKTCPPKSTLLFNKGFEEGSFVSWQGIGDCDFQIKADEQLAYSGNYLLSAIKNPTDCSSFFQDVYVRAEVGETYTFNILVKSLTNVPLTGRIVLWERLHSVNTGKDFNIVGNGWQCISLSAVIQNRGYAQFRPEIYLDTSGQEYHFDDASLRLGGGDCPKPDFTVDTIQLWQADGPFYPGGTVGVEMQIANIESGYGDESRTSCWVSEKMNGDPIVFSHKIFFTIPHLEKEQSNRYYADLEIPVGLTPNSYYAVCEANTQYIKEPTDKHYRALGELDRRNNRNSVEFTLSACSDTTEYCDVPTEHWARTEIEELELTTGCRTPTTPYLDRPFCPNQVLERRYLAIFLMRHIQGLSYQPPSPPPYRAYYSDVPVDPNQFYFWIEELYEMGYQFKREDCPPSNNQASFCPFLPVMRKNLAKYLVEIEGKTPLLALPAVQGDIFIDVTEDTLAGRAIEYLWRKGVLPDNESDCLSIDEERRFCSNEPVRRANFAAWMTRLFGQVEIEPRE